MCIRQSNVVELAACSTGVCWVMLSVQVTNNGRRPVLNWQVVFLRDRIVWWGYGHLGWWEPGNVVPCKLCLSSIQILLL